jgi:glycosyltransferase involved in cell wall biosynthesis
MPPLVSVVVPTYYRNDRLAAAVESVLAQTYPNVELVVVDDSGESHAAPIADRDGVEYVAFAENRGSNPARTAGIERASGAYVHLLDDDDRLAPERLERGVASLDGSDAQVGFCGFAFENGDERLPDPDLDGDVLERALAFDASPCVTSTLLVERDLLAAQLPLAERPGADDLGLIIDLARESRFDAVGESLVTRAVEPDSRGKSMGVVHGRRDILAEYADLYAEYPTARRRAQADTARLAGERHLEAGDRLPALREFSRALRVEPRPARAVALLGGVFGLRGYRASKHLSVRLP